MDTEKIPFRGTEREVVRGQLIVKVDLETARRSGGAASVLGKVLGEGNYSVLHPADDRGVCLIELPGVSAAELEGAADALAADPAVIFADPNELAEQCPVAPPNDPLLAQQWNLQRIDAEAAWSYNTVGPARVLIAVADSGIPMRGDQLSHEDLSNQRVFLVGSDFTGTGAVARDDNGHGTHVLGIAAARARNRKGIAGLAYTSATLSLKVFNAAGQGSAFWVYQAALEAVSVATSRNARLIFNYSGRGLTPNGAWTEAAGALRDAGAVLVAAAGNDSGPVGYPAALSPQFDNVIAVGATGQDDTLAGFSNTGPEINVVAPGVDILSTFPDYDVAGGFPRDYGAISGTSMAAPLVTALAAIVWTQYPFYDAARIRRRLEETAIDLGAPGDDPLYGAGRIDGRAALEDAPLDLGEPVPQKPFWPNAPVPPPAKPVFLDAIPSLGGGFAAARWFVDLGKPLDAKGRLAAVRDGMARDGAFGASPALDRAIGSPDAANVEAARLEVRGQAEAASLYKAPWLSLRGLFDVGYHMRYAHWFAGRVDDRATLLERLDLAQAAMAEARIFGVAYLEYEPFREEVEAAADGLAAARLIEAFDKKLGEAIFMFTGVIR